MDPRSARASVRPPPFPPSWARPVDRQSRWRILALILTGACIAALWSVTPQDLKNRYRAGAVG